MAKQPTSVFRNNGLSIVLIALFLVLWVAQSFCGRLEYNEEREERGEPPVTLSEYWGCSHFWEATGENWESEFLAIGSMVILSIFLRQRGSPESKPVAASMSQTADED